MRAAHCHQGSPKIAGSSEMAMSRTMMSSRSWLNTKMARSGHSGQAASPPGERTTSSSKSGHPGFGPLQPRENDGKSIVYFKSDDPADRGYRTVLLNPHHGGYGTFFGAGGIAISFNDMKVLEFQELFAAVLKGEPYLSDFEFGYHVDRTISACIASAKSGQWVRIED
jgi:hypothetical protein